MIATRIHLPEKNQLGVTWDDAHESRITLRSLRDHCPCAGCKGETILLRTYEPESSPEFPGKYELMNAEQIGYYALQLFWGDGHSTGMYTWEHLRSLCECAECLAGRSSLLLD